MTTLSLPALRRGTAATMLRTGTAERSNGRRRGATLVMVAGMIVLLGGMAAFALDIARVYAGTTELATGADAAALAGARRLQLTGVSPAAGTVAFASSNSAFGSPLAITQADVEGGVWNPANTTFTPSAWNLATAVRVTARRQTSMTFGRLMGLSTLTPYRRGVAWIANQATRDCIKPWGLDVNYVNSLLGQSITTQAGIAALQTQVNSVGGQQAMTVIAGPDGNTTGSTLPTRFQAITGRSSSRRHYQDAIIDLECGDNQADFTSGLQTNVQPGNGGGDVPRTTVQAVELDLQGNQGNGGVQTCRAQTDLNDATCYNPLLPVGAAGSAGVTITLAAVVPQGNNATISTFMEFRLMCVFRGGGVTGNGNPPGTSRSTEVCPWLVGNHTPTGNYIQGTLVGYPMPSVAVLGPGNTLGTAISTAQKLVLVQ